MKKHPLIAAKSPRSWLTRLQRTCVLIICEPYTPSSLHGPASKMIVETCRRHAAGPAPPGWEDRCWRGALGAWGLPPASGRHDTAHDRPPRLSMADDVALDIAVTARGIG